MQLCFGQAAITDIAAAFDHIGDLPIVITLTNKIKTPSGGHLQGIQPLNDSLLVLTASSADYSYYLQADHHQVRSMQKISDAPFRHAGGCQLADRTLVVGVEDNHAKDRSFVYMIFFQENGKEDERGIVIYRNGVFKRSTAGAVGYTLTPAGKTYIAVGDWDSRNIDLYSDMRDSIVQVATATAPDSLHWCSYQSINLLVDTQGQLYLVGLGLDGGRDRADLFAVQLSNGQAVLRLVRTRYFKCKRAGFRYGAGIHVTSDGKLEIYTCARNPAASIAINIFK